MNISSKAVWPSVMVMAACTIANAQGGRPMSPAGRAAAHVQGTWTNPGKQTFALGGGNYEGGKMKLETLPHSQEQLSWAFVDMTNTGGTIALSWDKTQALVPFTFGS